MAKINYIPNDPMASGVQVRLITAPQMPTGKVAKVSVSGSAPAAAYATHTPQFDFWQTQTSLVYGLKRWRELDGAYLPRWFGNRRTLRVLTNAGDDLNAFYDRASLQFFSHTFQGRTVHSCESPDVVNHEQGHAFLDAIRPDFFDVPFLEAAAFHEAFGDCYALLVALSDSDICRAALSASPSLGSHQFLSSLAEELGDAIRREFGAQHVEPGALRRALNTFRWADPLTLPDDAPASQLSSEAHNFSRVFTGCVYDTIRNIFNSGPATPANLGKAATTTGMLLLAAVRSVPLNAKVFDGVGRRMLQVDLTKNSGANSTHIQRAFAAHGIVLAAAATTLPVPIAVPATGAAAMRAVGAWMGVAKAKVHMTMVDTLTHGTVGHAAIYQPFKLKSAALGGLHILVPKTARVAMKGKSIVGSLGDPQPFDDQAASHAQAFAQALARNGLIDGVGKRRRGRQRMATHGIKSVGGKRTIVRHGFSCGPSCCAAWS